MSYSICTSCEQMVPTYEKYCAACLRRWPQLKQVADFWKHYVYTMESARELAKAEKAEAPDGR